MFAINRKQFINPEISKYIIEQTNMSIQKYLRNPENKLSNIKADNSYNQIRVSDLVSQKNPFPYFYNFLPFVAIISFLAGYNFHKLTN